MKKKVKVTLHQKAGGGPAAFDHGTRSPWSATDRSVAGINPIDPNRALSPGAFFMSDNFRVPELEVNRTLKPTSREHANLEAEKGETVVTNLDQANSGGIPEFYTIGGKRHYDGGTPLNLPPDSFIFSRDKKMSLKDKDILKQFGKNVGKKGKKSYTFAELSKQYDINPFRKILADPTSDKHQIDTAQKMIENYNLKLGALAMVQESTKGFPNGVPGIAMPYVEHVGMDPAQFFPQQPPQNAPQPQMRWGGQHNYFQQGGGPNAEEERKRKNLESAIVTPGTQINNPNILVPRRTPLVAKYSYLDDYTPTYDSTGTKIVTSADDPVYEKKRNLTSELLDIKRRMATTYNLPTTPQGIPDYRQMDVNQVLDKSQMDPADLKRMYEIMYEKRAIRDAQGFKRKQYYGDKEAAQRGFSDQTPLEDLDLGIRFATGVQSRQLQQLAAERAAAAAAEKKAQVDNITLQYGGQPKFQFQGEVPPNEADYTTGFNESNFDPTVYVNAPEPQMPANVDQYYNPINSPQQGEPFKTWWQRTKGTAPLPPEGTNAIWNGQQWAAPGTVPTTTKKATRSQNVPKDAVRWDMSLDGYEEREVQPGDYVKKKDGKWYKVTGHSKKNVAYEGGFEDQRLLGKLGDNQEYFGRLQQRIDGNPELREAIIKQYRSNIKKVKPGKNLTEADIAVARAMSDDQVIDNFYEAQKQIMAVKAHKGNLNDDAGVWDKDRNQYINAITELGFDPMTTGETAAFQTAYIGIQDLQKDSKFRNDLEDFELTPWGKKDEARGRISDIDGWMGNTTIGQAAMYAPKATQLEMEEAAWNEAAKEVKHLGPGAPARKTPFWTEDIMNLGFAARNLFSIERETPWNAMPGMKLPRATFMSPDQQIQNILGAAGKAADVAGGFGTPQAYMANVAKLQANAMKHVSNAIGTVHDRNVQVANQFERHRAQIMNNSNNRRAQLATNLHDKNAILNQQFTNAKNQAWKEVNDNLVNMWTNRGMTQNLNTLQDQYDIDPVTGYKYFTSPRPITPKDAQQPNVAGQINNLVAAVPGLTPDQAARIITKGAGDPAWSPTQQTGIDPTQTSPSYPGGAPAGYYPQG